MNMFFALHVTRKRSVKLSFRQAAILSGITSYSTRRLRLVAHIDCNLRRRTAWMLDLICGTQSLSTAKKSGQKSNGFGFWCVFWLFWLFLFLFSFWFGVFG